MTTRVGTGKHLQQVCSVFIFDWITYTRNTRIRLQHFPLFFSRQVLRISKFQHSFARLRASSKSIISPAVLCFPEFVVSRFSKYVTVNLYVLPCKTVKNVYVLVDSWGAQCSCNAVMYLHFEKTGNARSDCSILSLTWMGKVPDELPEVC